MRTALNCPDLIGHSRRQGGVTLVELMVALVLAALVVLASTAMVVTSRTSYRTQDETTRLAESARFALDLTNRMVRLAGYTNFGDDPGIPAFYSVDPAWSGVNASDAYATNGPDLVGAVNSKPVSGATVNNSDALTLRYFGANLPGDVDFGAVVDCAGYPVPQPVGAPASNLAIVNQKSRAFSILFVEPHSSTDPEPELKCQRQTYDINPASATKGAILGTAAPQTLIRGVEVFKVLYGEALYPLPSSGIPLDPDTDAPPYIAYRQGIGGVNAVHDWSHVVSIKIAMLLRSAPGSRPDPDSTDYALFGAADPTAHFATSTLATPERTRSRRLVQTTVFVRNRLANWPSLYVP